MAYPNNTTNTIIVAGIRLLLLPIFLVAVVGSFSLEAAETQKPNILLILADDMGYGDLGCMGSQQIRTPHIDGLASNGVLCRQAYVASSVCSPSRAGLLTGRDPRRFGYEGNLNASPSNYATRPELLGLPTTEHSLADHLKAAGYATALVGKWHLGSSEIFHPNKRGFDYFCGMLGGSHSYFPTKQNNKLERNGVPLSEFSSPYVTDFFTDEALQWISEEHQQSSDQPWFLYLSYNAPHTPMQATEEDLALYAHIKDERRRTYAAMMHALDRGIGRIVEYLGETGQQNDTLIVFFSDNGGATNNGSWNGPLSGAKGCAREGGIRIPMIWSYPRQLPKGTKYDGVVSSLDLLPTFLSAAGSEPLPLTGPSSHEDKRNRTRAVKRYGVYDGINLLPSLSGKSDPPPRTLFWRLQGQAAIRQGTSKLIRLSHRPAQLFDPSIDPAESNDLASEDREKFGLLFQELGRWEATLPTVPLWGSSPFWRGESAKIYDTWQPKPEPH